MFQRNVFVSRAINGLPVELAGTANLYNVLGCCTMNIIIKLLILVVWPFIFSSFFASHFFLVFTYCFSGFINK